MPNINIRTFHEWTRTQFDRLAPHSLQQACKQDGKLKETSISQTEEACGSL